MDKHKLNQYRSLQKEIPILKKKLDKLYKRMDNIPTVKGKVQSSSKDFPYIGMRVTVDMSEPKETERINTQISINESRLKKAETDKLEIESFIAGIQDSTDRLIFELVYQQGKTLEEVGGIVGYTKGRVSQKISNILKD